MRYHAKRIMLKAVWTLGMLLSAESVQAQNVYVIGAGTSSCGKYLEDRRKQSLATDAQYWQWAQGYLSAYNLEPTRSDGIPEIPKASTILAYLDRFCASNPLQRTLIGVANLAEELSGRPNRFPAK